jgi:hypothetical protein
MWLYLLVWLGTSALTISLSRNIDVIFLRLLATLFITAGFTFGAVYYNKVSLSAIYGRPPTIPGLILSLLMGAAIWVPSSWIMLIVYIALESWIGVLPPLLTQADVSQLFIQIVVFVPMTQGLLFWAYIQRAAEGIGRARGAALAATLFAFYGLITADLGLSSVVGILPLGVLAAFSVYLTGSAWCGTAVLSGYGVASLLQGNLFNFIGPDQFGIPFSPRWLLIVVITAFVAFILLQVLRATTKGEIDSRRARPRPLWWLPLTLSIAFFLLSGLGEIALRDASRRAQQRPAPASPGSTSPPIGPVTPTPIVTPGTQPTPRQ